MISSNNTRSFYSSYFQSSTNNQNSAFTDLASFTIPKTLKKLYPLLEYYATMDSTIAPQVQKAALYPITSIDYSKVKDEDRREKIKDFLEWDMDIFQAFAKLSLNYCAYGYAASSISFPFKRVFKCQKCLKKINSDFVNEYIFKDFNFFFKCPHCGDASKFKDFFDVYINDTKKVKFLIWRPHDLDYIFSQFTGEYQFFYTPPRELLTSIKSGNKFILDGTPKFILEALKKRTRIKLKSEDVFHMFRPHFARGGTFIPEGMPLILSALPPAYLKKVYSKASEVSAVLKASPASVIYPETNSGAGAMGNPLVSVSMDSFSSFMRDEILQHRKDPGHVLISPTPIGQQNLFGDAKQYNYYQEMKFQEQDMLQGMGFPKEFQDAGLSFSLASVPARMLENQMKKQSSSLQRFLVWAKDKLDCFVPLGDEKISMKSFRMADDMTLLQMQMNGSQQGDLSKTRIWETLLDIDYKEEMKRIKEEDYDKFDSLQARTLAETVAQLSAIKMQRNFEAQQKIDDERMLAAHSANNPGEIHLQQISQQAQMVADQTTQFKAMNEQLTKDNKDLERKNFQQNRLFEKEQMMRRKLEEEKYNTPSKAGESSTSVKVVKRPEDVFPENIQPKNTMKPIYTEKDPAMELVHQICDIINRQPFEVNFLISLLEKIFASSSILYYNIVFRLINEGSLDQQKFNLLMKHFHEKFPLSGGGLDKVSEKTKPVLKVKTKADLTKEKSK